MTTVEQLTLVEAVVGGVPAGQDAAGGHTSEVGAVASWA